MDVAVLLLEESEWRKPSLSAVSFNVNSFQHFHTAYSILEINIAENYDWKDGKEK
jgi:hypothetical protein